VWDIHIIWEAQIYTRTVHKGHCIPLEALTGDTIDISEWTEFEFYDLVVYWDNRDGEAGQGIGRWLGPSHYIGSALCYYILTEKATVLSRTSLQHITKEDFETYEMRERVRVYHEELNQNINAASEYQNEEDGDDFITDDVALPIGYQENEGNYFGLSRTPDIDDRNEASYYNPLKDHSIYEVVFPDGTTDEVEANLIAKCMV